MGGSAHVDLTAAQDQFSALVDRALAGEDIVITREGRPMVRLVPVESLRPHRRITGSHPELEGLGDLMLEPLPEDELRRWYGEE